eukprot:g4266.t1
MVCGLLSGPGRRALLQLLLLAMALRFFWFWDSVAWPWLDVLEEELYLLDGSNATGVLWTAQPAAPACTVSLGPIIGLTTSSSVRVLLEVSRDQPVTLSLQQLYNDLHNVPDQQPGPARQQILSQTRNMTADRPAIFAFQALAAGATFAVRVEGCVVQWPWARPEGPHGEVRTLPTDWRIEQSEERSQASAQAEAAGLAWRARHEKVAARFAVVSCHHPNASKRLGQQAAAGQAAPADGWAKLASMATRGEIDYLFHLGDQVYIDNGRKQGPTPGERILQAADRASWPQLQEQVRETYRSLYRRAWSRPAVARTLAHVPNLMSYDDHEVRDDHGLDICPEDRDPHSAAYFANLQARHVLYEYQLQLHADLEELFRPARETGGDHHWHVLQDFGWFFLDLHGARTWWRMGSEQRAPHSGSEEEGWAQEPLPFLGSRQWADLVHTLANHMQHVRLLLVFSPLPLGFVSPRMVHILSKKHDDLLGHYSFFPRELTRLLDLFLDWREARPGREVLLLCGDVHMGGHTELVPPVSWSVAGSSQRPELRPLQQFTVSGIVQNEPKWYELWAVTLLAHAARQDVIELARPSPGSHTEANGSVADWPLPARPSDWRLMLHNGLASLEQSYPGSAQVARSSQAVTDETDETDTVGRPHRSQQSPQPHGAQYHFRHRGWTRHNNFGLVEVRPGTAAARNGNDTRSQAARPSVRRWLVELLHDRPLAKSLRAVES